MPSSPDLLIRVRAALADLPGVVEKKMFGSIGFMVDGKLCFGVRPQRLMCRIDPATHAAALRRAGCTTVIMRGRPYPGYVYVDADALKTARALDGWVARALAYNRTLA